MKKKVSLGNEKTYHVNLVNTELLVEFIEANQNSINMPSDMVEFDDENIEVDGNHIREKETNNSKGITIINNSSRTIISNYSNIKSTVIINGVVINGSCKKSCPVKLTLYTDRIYKLFLENENGKITIHGGKLDGTVVKNSNGGICIENSQNIHVIQNKNGKIKINDSDLPSSTISNCNGKIEISDSNIDNSEISNCTGKNIIDNPSVTNSCSVTNVVGKNEIYAPSHVKSKIKVRSRW